MSNLNGKANGSMAFREEMLHEMREMAESGADVRTMAFYVQDKLGVERTAIIPVLAYFCTAFSLPLIEVLPIREWLGTDLDDDINREIMPKILKARTKWLQPSS